MQEQEEVAQSITTIKDENQLVTFLLKDEEYGFDIMSVQEIIRLPKMAKVPRTPTYVDGIANLRGVILPVIDMRSRFGMDRAEETDRTRVLVVDIGGVKTGLRVDRVKQVTRVLQSEMEPPPPAIQSTRSNYLDGVVKLDNGQRIIMALNAARICELSIPQTAARETVSTSEAANIDSLKQLQHVDTEVQKMVTFRIAKEEFAFPLEDVREILRVQTPNQVPDVPEYVLGVLTVRGKILPVVDLRKLLQQESLANELVERCRPLREQYERWIDAAEKVFAGETQSKLDLSIMECLRSWISDTNSSSQLLMENLAKARALNEMVAKHLHNRSKRQESGDRDAVIALGKEVISAGRETVAALYRFEQVVAANIQEDQRIIVVDSEGVVLGLVVDHVHEVLNVAKSLVQPPPNVTSNGGMELSGVAQLEEGARLIMLLNVANLMKDQNLRNVSNSSLHSVEQETILVNQRTGAETNEQSEVQLVTFLLGEEEFGIPISQIQEIDRLGKITKVPNAAPFIEGVTNLRGEVIPVLDTRKRFDLAVKPSDDRTRIMIVDIGGVKTGLVVDSVREVMNMAKKDIAPPPEAIGSGIDQQFISGIGKVDGGKRMIVLLDVEKILSRQEQTHLSDVHVTN